MGPPTGSDTHYETADDRVTDTLRREFGGLLEYFYQGPCVSLGIQMERRVNYSGLVVAGTGFVLTRFTVVLAVNEAPVQFYLSGVVPLTLGLGLSAFGVALAVADVDASVARTTAVWCVLGTTSMLALVVLTLLGSEPDAFTGVRTLRSRTGLTTSRRPSTKSGI